MEILFEFLAELGVSCCTEGFLGLLEVFAAVKSHPNRRVRRAARRAGERLPARDIWSWVLIIVTMSLVALGAMIIVGWLVQNL